MSTIASHRERDGVAVLELNGDLDLSDAVEIEGAIRGAEAAEPRVIVLDLRGVTFIDSTVLRTIVSADARARREGRRLVVAVGTEPVRRVFRITLLEWRLEIVDDPAGIGSDHDR